MNYNICKLIKIRSDVELPLPNYFTSDIQSSPDIKFLEEDLDFEKPKECKVMRIGSYYWQDGRKLRFEHPKGAKLEIDLNDEMNVRFNSKFTKLSSKTTLEHLSERLLQMGLVDKGIVMVHSGCVAFNNDGMLIVAPPDFGKTSTVLSLAAKGAKFLGDDHVLINENAEVFCYPRKLRISPHTITSGVVKPVSPWKRVLAKFGSFYAVVLRLFGSQHELREVPEKFIKNCATIKYAVMLKGFASSPQLEPIGKTKVKENMIESMVLPVPYMTGFPDSYVDLYLYLRGVGLWAFLERSMEIVRTALRGVECYEVKGQNIGSWPQAIREKFG